MTSSPIISSRTVLTSPGVAGAGSGLTDRMPPRMSLHSAAAAASLDDHHRWEFLGPAVVNLEIVGRRIRNADGDVELADAAKNRNFS